MKAHCVVGSGPVGVACARALLDNGHHVVLLDGGQRLEASKEALLQSAGCVDILSSHVLEELNRPIVTPVDDQTAIPDKLIFGSDYPYRGSAEFTGLSRGSVELVGSLATGGFSNVWGAAVLPYRQADLSDWPREVRDLTDDYRAVEALLNVANARDNWVSDVLGYQFAVHRPLRLQRHAECIVNRTRVRRGSLERRGVYVDRAIVAIDPSTCLYCGNCLSGCPRSSVYSGASTLRELMTYERFHYRPNWIVTRFDENADAVAVKGYDRNTGEALELVANQLFLGAGAVHSVKIVAESLGWMGRELQIKDSSYFLFPSLVFGPRQEAHGRLYTLAQLFLELIDSKISHRAIHFQLYGQSNFLLEEIRAKIPSRLPFSDRLVNLLASHTLIFQMFLHSDDSHGAYIRLVQDGKQLRLEARAVSNPRTGQVFKLAMRKLRGLSHIMGIIPLPFARKCAPVGRSFHFGGSLPMSSHPEQPSQSDLLGRPGGLRRVHVIDSSIFPSIPASTITFTAMANAHRIGRLSGQARL